MFCFMAGICSSSPATSGITDGWMDVLSISLIDLLLFFCGAVVGTIASQRSPGWTGFLCSCSNFPFSSLLIVNHQLDVDATLMVGLRAWNKVLCGVIMTTVNAIPFYSFFSFSLMHNEPQTNVKMQIQELL